MSRHYWINHALRVVAAALAAVALLQHFRGGLDIGPAWLFTLLVWLVLSSYQDVVIARRDRQLGELRAELRAARWPR